MTPGRMRDLAGVLRRDAEMIDHDPRAMYIVPMERTPTEVVRLVRSKFKARMGLHATIRMREIAAELEAAADELEAAGGSQGAESTSEA